MVFRDDREALRQRVVELRKRTGALEAQRDELLDELEALEEAITTEAKRKARAALAPPLLIASLVLGGLVLGVLFGGSASAEVRFAWVAEAQGSAPAAAGERCTVFVHAADEDRAQMDLLCPRGIVYGGGNAGYLPCVPGPGTPFGRCQDTASDDGDPAIMYDATAGTIVVGEPGWRLVLRLYQEEAP